MKDTLGAAPPTIASCCRQKMTGFTVHCGAPCRHVGRVAFDALRLPDTTIFIEIPKLRRIVCQACGRRASEIMPDWSQYIAVGNGRPPLDGWYIVTREAGGGEGRSSRMISQEAALAWAGDLEHGGIPVLRIEGPTVDMTADDVAAWLKANSRSSRTPAGE